MSRRRLAAVLFALMTLGLVASFAILPVAARLWQPQARLSHGTVMLLERTPYYWVADEAGVLHWVSDTRALVGRYAKWDQVREITLAELERLPRGEPWLPHPVAFVREDDQLYLVKWESGLKWPALLRVPSVDALEIFGITSRVIEARTLDRQTWERLFGVPFDDLIADLTLLTPSMDTQEFDWFAGTWSGVGTQQGPSDTYPVVITLSKPALDPSLGVVIGTVDYPSFPCGGPLGLISLTPEAVILAERFTIGLEHCTDQGRTTLTRRSEWRLFYLWTLPDDPMTVTGQLLRRDEPS